MSVTTQRPPYTPEKFGHMAGRVFDPDRRTADASPPPGAGRADDAAPASGGAPAYYGKKADRDARSATK